MEPFEFCAPRTLPEALELLREGEAMPLAGGTAAVIMMKQNLLTPRRVVWLGRVEGFRAVEIGPSGALRAGAGCTLADVARSPAVGAGWPALARAAGGVGNVRVRAVATVGGHLAHADPAQDLPPLLLVLGAEVSLRGPGGSRTLPLAGFFVDYMETALAPGELVTGVVVPPLPSGSRAAYVKFTPRSEDDFATVGVAARVDVAPDGTVVGAAVALGGVGPVPVSVPGAGAALSGRRPSRETVAAAGAAAEAAAAPWDDQRGSAAYKKAMSRVWTRRCLEALLA